MITGNVDINTTVRLQVRFILVRLAQAVRGSTAARFARTISSAATWSLSGCRICSGGSFGRFATVRTSSQFSSISAGILTEVNGIDIEIPGKLWYNVTKKSYIKIRLIA